MVTHRFTLIVDGPDSQAEPFIDQFYDAPLVGLSHGGQSVDFWREAASLEEAICSAIADIGRLDGVEVVRVAGAGLVSLTDIAARTGCTSESIRRPAEGLCGPGTFLAPVTDPPSRHRLWRLAEVDRWFETSVSGHQADGQEQAAPRGAAGHPRRLYPGAEAAGVPAAGRTDEVRQAGAPARRVPAPRPGVSPPGSHRHRAHARQAVAPQAGGRRRRPRLDRQRAARRLPDAQAGRAGGGRVASLPTQRGDRSAEAAGELREEDLQSVPDLERVGVQEL